MPQGGRRQCPGATGQSHACPKPGPGLRRVESWPNDPVQRSGGKFARGSNCRADECDDKNTHGQRRRDTDSNRQKVRTSSRGADGRKSRSGPAAVADWEDLESSGVVRAVRGCARQGVLPPAGSFSSQKDRRAFEPNLRMAGAGNRLDGPRLPKEKRIEHFFLEQVYAWSLLAWQ